MDISTYEAKLSNDGKWRIHETVLRGSVTHHGVLHEEFDTEEEALARIEELESL